jgi:hypothetical protein
MLDASRYYYMRVTVIVQVRCKCGTQITDGFASPKTKLFLVPHACRAPAEYCVPRMMMACVRHQVNFVIKLSFSNNNN